MNSNPLTFEETSETVPKGCNDRIVKGMLVHLISDILFND
jgi:hypothetical protein